MIPWEKFAQRRDGRLLIVSGPAGSGKTTVCHRLQESFENISRVITATTRPVRLNERPGIDYHFLSLEEFKRRINNGEFLEHAEVHGNLYGTPLRSVLEPLRSGRDLVLNIDVQGARTLREKAAATPLLNEQMASCFILPPNLEELRRRLLCRGRDPESEIETRLQNAVEEMKDAYLYDYVLVSRTYDEDAAAISAIYQAEKMRTVSALD